jgi:hypothetical protein
LVEQRFEFSDLVRRRKQSEEILLRQVGLEHAVCLEGVGANDPSTFLKLELNKINKHIRNAGGLGRGIPFLSDSFFSHRILCEAWFI